jgi:hypothetical protein
MKPGLANPTSPVKVAEQQIRTVAFVALAIGAVGCVVVACVWLDGALLKHPSAFARFLAAYLILAVAAGMSRGRLATAIVLLASLGVSWLGISTYLDWIRHPLVFDLGRFTWIKQCFIAILAILIAGMGAFMSRHRQSSEAFPTPPQG